MAEKTFSIDNISSITEYFSLNELDSFMLSELSQYMDEYINAENEYLSSPAPSKEMANRLEKLTQPINVMYTQFPVEDEQSFLPPAVEYIKSRINKQKQLNDNIVNENEGNEMGNARTMVPKSSLHSHSNINGFANYIIVLFFTAILGIMLGALLFFIGN